MRAVSNFKNLKDVALHYRKDLTGDNRKEKDLILFFAHNGTGKTRLSMQFKEMGKSQNPPRDTLYFNAFTEDLFVWNNDLENDLERVLTLNSDSAFFDSFKELNMDTKIGELYQNYVNLKPDIDYDNYKVTFSRSVVIEGKEQRVENIKISRGEENLFIWCCFVAVCQVAIDQVSSNEDSGVYNWVKFIYIDDPISSLDENKAITIACDLGNLLRKMKEDGSTIKTVISTHHSLFFNVMYNELKSLKHKFYYLHSKSDESYTLQDTTDVPFFHHIAIISQLKKTVESGEIYTYHFNTLRSVLEKTASFFGYDRINKCIHGLDDEVLFNRALNLFSHGKYSIYNPKEMGEDNKELFKNIFNGFIEKYEFYIPEIFNEQKETA